MRQHGLAGLVFIAGLVILAAPSSAIAQVDLGGATRITFAGSGVFGQGNTSLNNIVGLSRFTESGWEIGGAVDSTISSFGGGDVSYSGVGLFQVGFNFIGESLTVPFLAGTFGIPLQKSNNGLNAVYGVGGGFKRFFDERASFDVQVTYRNSLLGGAGSGSIALLYGVSIYVR